MLPCKEPVGGQRLTETLVSLLCHPQDLKKQMLHFFIHATLWRTDSNTHNQSKSVINTKLKYFPKH